MHVDALLGKLPQPVSVGGFSMKEQGYGLGKFLAGGERFEWTRGQWVGAGALSTRRADHTVVSLTPETPRADEPLAGGCSQIFAAPTLLVFGGVNAPTKQAISWADFYRPVAQATPRNYSASPAPRNTLPGVMPLEPQQLRASSCLALRLAGTPTRVLVMGPAGGTACSSMGVRAFRVDMFLPADGLGCGTVAESGTGIWRRCTNIPTPRLHFSAAAVCMTSDDSPGLRSTRTRSCTQQAREMKEDAFDTLMIEKQYSGSGNTWPSNECVVVTGGLDADRKVVGTVEIYNPLRDYWYSRAECDDGMNSVASAAAIVDSGDEHSSADDAEIEGHLDDDSSGSDDNDDGDDDEEIGVGIWKRTMIEPRWGACAVVTRGGRRIDILGGTDGNGIALNSTESFDVERREYCACTRLVAGWLSHCI